MTSGKHGVTESHFLFDKGCCCRIRTYKSEIKPKIQLIKFLQQFQEDTGKIISKLFSSGYCFSNTMAYWITFILTVFCDFRTSSKYEEVMYDKSTSLSLCLEIICYFCFKHKKKLT